MRELTDNENKTVNGGSGVYYTPTVTTVAGTGGSAVNTHTYNQAAANESFPESIYHMLR